MGAKSETQALYDMAGAMLKLGKQHLGAAGLAEFVRDYPDLAEPEYLRAQAWSMSAGWLWDLANRGERAEKE